jgi:hypothetical protein
LCSGNLKLLMVELVWMCYEQWWFRSIDNLDDLFDGDDSMIYDVYGKNENGLHVEG